MRLWRVDGERCERTLELASASREPDHIARLFAGKLDNIDAGFGIDQVQMLATWLQPLDQKQSTLDGGASAKGTTLATCIDRMTARLGTDAITRPVPYPSHYPERSQRWHPPLSPQAGGQQSLSLYARPIKLFDRPEPITVIYATPEGLPRSFRWRNRVHDIARVEGPERIAPEWWRERKTVRLRDYYRVEDSEGQRYWIYRYGHLDDGRGALPDWFVQGMFG